MSKVAKSVLLLFISIAFFSTTSVAQEKVKPKITPFGDWGRICEKVPGVEEDVCYIFQQLKKSGTDSVVMNTSIAINPKDGKPVISVVVPLGLLLPAGVQMKVDENEFILRIPFILCIPQGCRASAGLDESFIKEMLAGQQLVAAFVNAKREPAKVPLSLKGFEEAYASLKK